MGIRTSPGLRVTGWAPRPQPQVPAKALDVGQVAHLRLLASHSRLLSQSLIYQLLQSLGSRDTKETHKHRRIF